MIIFILFGLLLYKLDYYITELNAYELEMLFLIETLYIIYTGNY